MPKKTLFYSSLAGIHDTLDKTTLAINTLAVVEWLLAGNHLNFAGELKALYIINSLCNELNEL